MAIIRRVDTVMTGVSGTPYYNSLYFTLVESVSATDMIGVVTDFWGDLLALSTNQLRADISAEVVRFNDATQEIVDYETGIGNNVSGQSSAQQYPRATQALLRARTDSVVAGRRIQGRVFVPGISGATVDPTVPTDVQTQFTAIGNQFVAATASLGPWRINSRKNGTSAVVTSTSCWEQWSVLRSRRD